MFHNLSDIGVKFMLTLLLAESSLELVPKKIAKHPSVVVNAKRRGKRSENTLLESTLHHTAMKKLQDSNRRGRPDIIHTFLLVALESILNKEGDLNVYIHTRNDHYLIFNPEIRLPKHYNRFIGLMEQLFFDGSVPREPSGDSAGPLIQLKSGKSLYSIVDDHRTFAQKSGRDLKVIILSDSGRSVEARTYFRTAAESGDDHLIIIGGFPEGGFSADLEKLKADDIISIHTERLKTWTVASEVLVNFRDDNTPQKTDKEAGGGT